MPIRKLSKKEILDKYSETVKYLKRKGAVSMMITERYIVLFSEKGSTLTSIGLPELEKIEESLKGEQF